ncbi:MAG TPA: putative molybdenum carrier protein, partial [Gammaproteobacteria bacterium]|nr:putative molybdenum carrier protein [Gammaproteobacteria bacterium]
MSKNASLRIVTGGQTGVDRAALDAALELGLACGGWCPKGRWAEDGEIPPRYPLKETTSTDPARRTRANVRDADATLVLTDGEPTGGTRLTMSVA